MTELEAINLSIEHWKENLDNCILYQLEPDLCLEEIRDAIDISPDSCPLCQKYNDDLYDCRSCPIYKKTGHEDCENSPYIKVSDIRKEFLDLGSDFDPDIEIVNLQKAIEKELEFLYSLLEE